MMVRHHPDSETLMAYASGNLAEGFSLVVAVHLAACVACRDAAYQFDAVGGVLLDDLPPAALATDSFARTMSRIGEQAPDTAPAKRAAFNPTKWWEWPPLDSYLGSRAPRFWRPLGLGIGYSPIKRRGTSGASSILLRIAPGAALLDHGHAGMEMSIVLEGGYTDAQSRFGVGDFSTNDTEVRHKPVADSDEYCVTLVGLGGPLQFGGAAVRLMQALAGI